MRRRGLNLLEMMIAMTLFGWMVIALTSMWVAHTRAIEAASDTLVASNLAESVMEDQTAMGFRVEPVEPTAVEINRIVDGQVTPQEYTYRVDVVDTSGPAGPDIKEVTVRVTWNEQGHEKEVKLVGFVYWQS